MDYLQKELISQRQRHRDVSDGMSFSKEKSPNKKPSKRGIKKQRRALRSVNILDLQCPRRLQELFERAVATRVVSSTLHFDFFAAAAHALAKGRDPVKLFCHIVKEGCWHTIGQEAESTARQMFKSMREPIKDRAVRELIESLMAKMRVEPPQQFTGDELFRQLRELDPSLK